MMSRLARASAAAGGMAHDATSRRSRLPVETSRLVFGLWAIGQTPSRESPSEATLRYHAKGWLPARRAAFPGYLAGERPRPPARAHRSPRLCPAFAGTCPTRTVPSTSPSRPLRLRCFSSCANLDCLGLVFQPIRRVFVRGPFHAGLDVLCLERWSQLSQSDPSEPLLPTGARRPGIASTASPRL